MRTYKVLSLLLGYPSKALQENISELKEDSLRSAVRTHIQSLNLVG